MCDSYTYRARLLSPSSRSSRFGGWADWPRKERSGEGPALASRPLASFACARTRAKPVSALKISEGGRPRPRVKNPRLDARPQICESAVAGGDRLSELLLPPLGLALIHLLLQLADVLCEIRLLLAEPGLEGGDRLLALFELGLPDLGVRLEPRPAGLDLRLALVELPLPVGDRLFRLPEPLLTPLDARPLRLEERLRARDLRLAGGELAAELVEATGLILQGRGGLPLGLVAAHRRLAPRELRLARRQLALLRRHLGPLRAHRGDDLAGARPLVGEALEVSGQPVRLRLQLRLARLEVLFACRHRRARLDELALPLCELAIAIGQLGLLLAEHRLPRREDGLPRLDARGRLDVRALGVRDRALEVPLPLGERRLLLGELGGDPGAFPLRRRQLAELERDLLLALGSAGLGRGELGLQIGQALLLCGRRLGSLDELVLTLLELCLLGGEPRRALVNLGRAQ